MPKNRILSCMLDRLFAAMLSGPNLNCRPHASRQRIDLMSLSRLQDIPPEGVLRSLLGESKRSKIQGRVEAPTQWSGERVTKRLRLDEDGASENPAAAAWYAQQSLLHKLRYLAEDALTYEQETGVHVLNVGFPLLTLAPGVLGGSRRVLAPIAFMPVDLMVKTGASPGIELVCREHGSDLVVPNQALLVWLERETGKNLSELFDDEEGVNPWGEICGLVKAVAALLNLAPPAQFGKDSADGLTLESAPRADDGPPKSIVCSAVLGLFPLTNQALLRDTQHMIAAEQLDGPVVPFIDVNVRLEIDSAAGSTECPPDAATAQRRVRQIAQERLVSQADPCQSKAVRLARESTGLVIHGPPGTGKSQTIANIIGDHLSRGQRVLFVCDKRTALDVVANRLEHMGLGALCALIHDPHSDRRHLYQALRQRLEELPEQRENRGAAEELKSLDEELQNIHDELLAFHDAVGTARNGSSSLHQRIGRWLELTGRTGFQSQAIAPIPGIDEAAWRVLQPKLEDVFERGLAVNFAENPWVRSVGITLDEFMGRSMMEVRQQVSEARALSEAADQWQASHIPPFARGGASLPDQVDAREAIIRSMEKAKEAVSLEAMRRWSEQKSDAVDRARSQLISAQTQVSQFRSGVLDPELALAANAPELASVNAQIAAVEAYLDVARKWYAFICLGPKRELAKVCRAYGASPSVQMAQRLRTFLVAFRARIVLSSLCREWTRQAPSGAILSDEVIASTLAEHQALFELLALLAGQTTIAADLIASWGDREALALILDGLQRSRARAEAITTLLDHLKGCRLFDSHWLDAAEDRLFAGKSITADMTRLDSQIDTLESTIRLRQELDRLPNKLRAATLKILQKGVSPASSMQAIESAVLSAQINARLQQSSVFKNADAHRLQLLFKRYRELELKKQPLVRSALLCDWIRRQRQRLLVSTGTRLNTIGADLKRRLTLRGDRAMRLRQVVAAGQEIEGGDPLFELCPVWMASPETAAQIFPRKPLFDLVVFDEASQCRLEEALPVMLRAQRVVVAGDPKQLPPTRFFETTISSSDKQELETDQDLFEAQQGEIEDLLGAALNLDIQESYLDVHYRSRNADLIDFSNQHFYGSRLQSIPAHPQNRARFAPISLYRVNGVYEDRTNETEAQEVCRIVGDLLKRASPPSIGVACFNQSQRDLIVDVLEECAEKDAGFGQRLAAARTRRGDGSFEGLFVKNLENVQGDERDHIIISTTYGPDAKGRFYRRFGPLGMAGGGRRLNVLITRARHEVHLVTSIPAEVYRALPPIPPGAQAGGPWLLFSYLHYAEQLADVYETTHRILAQSESPAPGLEIRPTRTDSLFAQALGRTLLSQQQCGSTVHWGNEGFSIDVVLHHPHRIEEVTAGLLCDITRYEKAEDPIEWEVFRTVILQDQGWQLHRVWTPHFFRDPQAALNAIGQQVAECLRSDADTNDTETP